MYITPCPLLPISIPSVIHSIILCISLPAPPLPSLSSLNQSLPRFTPTFYVYHSLPPPLPHIFSLSLSPSSSFPLLSISIPSTIHSIILCISLPAPSSSSPLPPLSSLSLPPPLISLSPLYQSLLGFTPSFYVYLPSLSSLYQSLP